MAKVFRHAEHIASGRNFEQQNGEHRKAAFLLALSDFEGVNLKNASMYILD